MHATFSISRLLAFVALLFVLGGVSAAPLPLDEASTNEVAELAERSAMHNGGRGTYYYPGLGACGWVRIIIHTHLSMNFFLEIFH